MVTSYGLPWWLGFSIHFGGFWGGSNWYTVQRRFKRFAGPAQIALAWCLTQGAIPIPKASSKQHITDNAAAADIRLTLSQLHSLANLATQG